MERASRVSNWLCFAAKDLYDEIRFLSEVICHLALCCRRELIIETRTNYGTKAKEYSFALTP